MKTISLYYVLVIILSLTGCSTKKTNVDGYDNLDTLYEDFVIYFKKGGKELEDYCHNIVPDEATIAYMKEHNVTYRGIPADMEKHKIGASFLAQEYYKRILNIRDQLERSNQLYNLEYIGREQPEQELYDDKLNVYATETYILMQSGNDTLKIKLGEMFNYGGTWRTFTNPR